MDNQIIWSGGKAFAQCEGCGKFVQLNKPLLGGLHFCDIDYVKAIEKELR